MSAYLTPRPGNPSSANMARVYADINAQMPRAYWDYDSVNISWGILENYEVVRKIGTMRLKHESMFTRLTDV